MVTLLHATQQFFLGPVNTNQPYDSIIDKATKPTNESFHLQADMDKTKLQSVLIRTLSIPV